MAAELTASEKAEKEKKEKLKTKKESPWDRAQRLSNAWLEKHKAGKVDQPTAKAAVDFLEYYSHLYAVGKTPKVFPVKGVPESKQGDQYLMYHAAVNAAEFIEKNFKKVYGEASTPEIFLGPWEVVKKGIDIGSKKARYQAFGDHYAEYDEYSGLDGSYYSYLYDEFGNKYYVDRNYVASGKLARYDDDDFTDVASGKLARYDDYDDYYYHYGGDLGNYYGPTAGQRVHRNRYRRRKLQQYVDNGDMMDLDSSLILGMVLFIGCIALIGLIAVLYRYKQRKYKMQRNSDKMEMQLIDHGDNGNEF